MFTDVQLVDGDLPEHTRLIEGPELIAQRIRMRLSTFRGEWLLDRRAGLPFLRWRSQRSPPLEAMAARVRDDIASIPGILEVRALRAEQVDDTIRLSGEVRLEEGAALDLSVEVATSGNTSPTVALNLSHSGAPL
ncbi:hypothetical protein DL240_09160 [Lujinxingia litoralis]|uniref:IraD/Gp25-like domain-containing protein n=1 Tax=Lujinxingia litoralis TaxID=2211119 RepID=A0A328C8V3_9DELT|nr:hypothetical protein [Lujinxingia litoralis]RAL23044.1 hypothetical protein DL240_09160 [Lujinxingia litoralis]